MNPVTDLSLTQLRKDVHAAFKHWHTVDAKTDHLLADLLLVQNKRHELEPQTPAARRLSTNQVLLDGLEQQAAGCDAILVSHYVTGVVTAAVADRVRQLARQHGAAATVDAQADLGRFAGFDLVKCNRAEAEGELGLALSSDADFERALVRLMPRLGVDSLVITRGGDGISALQRGLAVVHSPALRTSDIYDVVGAGDTVIAVLTLAMAARLSLASSLYLANAAAGLVVRKLGNAVVTGPELAAAVGGRSDDR